MFFHTHTYMNNNEKPENTSAIIICLIKAFQNHWLYFGFFFLSYGKPVKNTQLLIRLERGFKNSQKEILLSEQTLWILFILLKIGFFCLSLSLPNIHTINVLMIWIFPHFLKFCNFHFLWNFNVAKFFLILF